MPTDMMSMGDEMGAGHPPPAAPKSDENEDNPGTIFLSKEALGGRTVKVGETLSLTVKSVDPETSDVEAQIEESNENEPGMGGSSEAEFDKAMPPEEGAM
jgi:hypothetical protein